METALTPLEFGRRARKLYGDREGVVDGDLRLTYEQFFDRCDRWSAALQGMGVKKGDRVAYIAPNTHEQLESFYAVPQIGAVLVPINYRLTPEDFVYITTHSGAKVLCVHPDHMEAVDSVRGRLEGVEQFVALGSAGARASVSMPSETSRPSTWPPAPTASASPCATRPVPQPTSSTRPRSSPASASAWNAGCDRPMSQGGDPA